jgi:hypothetical protein
MKLSESFGPFDVDSFRGKIHMSNAQFNPKMVQQPSAGGGIRDGHPEDFRSCYKRGNHKIQVPTMLLKQLHSPYAYRPPRRWFV